MSEHCISEKMEIEGKKVVCYRGSRRNKAITLNVRNKFQNSHFFRKSVYEFILKIITDCSFISLIKLTMY